MDADFRPSDNHYTVNGYRERMTRKQAQSLLLGGTRFRNGELCEWKVKHVGVGVYEAWMEPKK